MTEAQAAPSRKARYLIHAVDGAPVVDFLALAEIDPEITVVDVIGPHDAPHTVVVEISADKARVLELHFRSTGTPSHQLTIEPDQPLSLFDSTQTGPI
ncbi:hypothetical protein [Rugamonas rivuli]|uniref:Uncharacterized protein n=1 Tax=Rugamonas rivuli TaxID=2743358 RepID=A0A843SAU0_9BURK|nr:hypothetical protein [Rugamonas rivuli]MQA19608.1 hypothetical protein [Rugamonas rivuli]